MKTFNERVEVHKIDIDVVLGIYLLVRQANAAVD